jgi:hypothetical protein
LKLVTRIIGISNPVDNFRYERHAVEVEHHLRKSAPLVERFFSGDVKRMQLSIELHRFSGYAGYYTPTDFREGHIMWNNWVRI